MGTAWDGTGPSFGGLCVMNVISVVPHDDAAPDFFADMWRVLPQDSKAASACARTLHIYWESEVTDTRGFETYQTNSGKWVSVEKGKGFEVSHAGKRWLYPHENDGAWDLHISDFSAVLILILPEGVGASKGQPAPRATLRNGRVMLFIEAGPSHNGKLTAALKLIHDREPSDLREIVANLNKAYYKSAASSSIPSRQSSLSTESLMPELATSRPTQDSPIQPPKENLSAEPARSLQAAVGGILVAWRGSSHRPQEHLHKDG